MIRSAVLLLIAAVAVLPTLAVKPGLAPGDQAPTIVGWNQEEEAVRLEFPGPVTFVHFWTLWSQPSRKQLRGLQEIAEAHPDRELRIVGIVHQRVSREQVVAVREAYGVQYDLITPNPRFDKSWSGVGLYPTSFLVNDKGVVVRRYLGWSERHQAAMLHDVDALLNGGVLSKPVSPEPGEALSFSQYRDSVAAN